MSLSSYIRWQRGVMTRAGFKYEEPAQWRLLEGSDPLPKWVTWIALVVVVAGLVAGALLSHSSSDVHCVKPPSAWRSICSDR
jgi:hypothetical protein